MNDLLLRFLCIKKETSSDNELSLSEFGERVEANNKILKEIKENQNSYKENKQSVLFHQIYKENKQLAIHNRKSVEGLEEKSELMRNNNSWREMKD